MTHSSACNRLCTRYKKNNTTIIIFTQKIQTNKNRRFHRNDVSTNSQEFPVQSNDFSKLQQEKKLNDKIKNADQSVALSVCVQRRQQKKTTQNCTIIMIFALTCNLKIVFAPMSVTIMKDKN